MADHNKPTTTSLYADFVTELKGRIDDTLKGLDPATTTPTNVPTSSIRWTSAGSKWQKWNGTAWGDLAAEYAINVNGYAAKLKTARTISLFGAATGTATSFDGSGNISIPVTDIDPAAISGTVPISKGGTGGATASAARANLGLVKQTSASDDTAGSLITVGGFGLGGLPPIWPNASFDNFSGVETGFYYIDATVTNKPDFSIGTSYNAMVLFQRFDADYLMQTVTLVSGADRLRQQRRVVTTTDTSGWGEVYDTQNIVGGLQISGGLPKGSIISSGNNASGYYLKFTDGSMICGGAVNGYANVASGSIFKDPTARTITYASAFNGAPYVAASCARVESWVSLGSPTSSGCTATMMCSFSSGSVGAIYFTAFGRWVS